MTANRHVYYMAHPLRPTQEEIDATEPYRVEPGRNEYELDSEIWIPYEERVKEATLANAERAMRWLAWLRRSFPLVTFIAPWIASVLAGDDDRDPVMRAAGIADAVTLIPRLDGVVMVGGRVSEGMRCEGDVARQVVSLTHLGAEPPREVPADTADVMRQLARGERAL